MGAEAAVQGLSDLWLPLSLLTSVAIFSITAYFFYYFILHPMSKVCFFKCNFKPSFVAYLMEKTTEEETKPQKRRWFSNLFLWKSRWLVLHYTRFLEFEWFLCIFDSSFYYVLKILKNIVKVTRNSYWVCLRNLFEMNAIPTLAR